MANNAKVKFITSESVAPGHPDKVCDQISDAVLDEVMRQDPLGRVACETYITMGLIIVGGEITTSGFVDVHSLVRDVLKEIGYTHQKYGFDYHTCAILNAIHAQSPDIAQGVDKGGAGDQGMMIGYACQETPELMPLPITLCHKLVKRMVEVRKEGILNYLGPDGKSQVTIEYENNKPKRVENVVLACQHTDEILDETGEKITEKARKEMIDVIALPVLGDLIDERTKFFVNETGKFVIGGPQSDTGMTGRKIIVDTYGGTVPHGGGAFCIHGDSLVSTEKGLLKIRDIKKEVENGLFVKTDTHPHRAKTWYDNGQKETIEIVTRSGYKIEGTPNQKIRIINKKGNYVWKRLDQLTKNDFVAIQLKDRLFGEQADVSNFKYIYKKGTVEKRKNKFIYPKILTDDYAYLLGLLIGDGNCMNRGGIWICVCEKEQKDNIQNLYKRLFGREGKIFGHWAFMGGVEMRAYLEYLGLEYKRSWEKEVPWSIFQAPKKVVAAFLRGLFDTDGSIRIHGRNKNFPDIKLYSTSQQLIKGVQQLLLNFGVVSQVGQVDATGKKFIIGKENRKATSRRKVYNLRIKNVEGVKIFKSEFIFNLPRKRKILNKINLEHKRNYFIIPHQRNRIKNLWQYLTSAEHQKDKCNIGRFTRFISDKATKNLTYQKLKEFLSAHKKRLGAYKDFQYLQFLYKLYHFYDGVTKIKSSRSSTYDLYVPGVNTFIANGFVCHNSGKDSTKVDRSGAYLARYIAKNIVAAGLAEKCFVQIAYVIGVAQPISIMVDTFGTGKIPEEKIVQIVKENFNLTPKGIIEAFDLRRPIFRQTARFGHFGREEFPWEKTDKVQMFQKYL